MSYDFSQFSQKVAKALDHLRNEVGLIRTGKASVQMLDSVRVEAYGSLMSLQEVSQVSTAGSDSLIVKPWDKSLLEAIEKAIISADLNLQAIVDKESVRIPVPPLTEERRKEMVKVLQQKIEQGKIMLRTVRTDTKKAIENMEGQDGVSEDHIKQDLEQLEKKIKDTLEEVDQIFEEKKAELMKV